MCAEGSGDLAWFSSLGLGEHGQEHDAASRGDPVGDSEVASVQYESEFAQRTLELSDEWFVEQRAILGESVDEESDLGLVDFVEFEVPGTDFALQFDSAKT